MPFSKSSRKNSTRCLALLLLVLFAAAGSISAQKPQDLKPQGYVNDFANVLSASTKQKLTALCQEVDSKAQAQIAVVTVSSLDGEDAQQYSLDLASHWGVGPKQQSRGVLILVAPNDHKYFTQVGYGLEPILPDGKVGGFGREMVPLLRQNNYDGAVTLLTSRVASVIAQDKGVTLDAAPTQPPSTSQGNSNASGINPIWVFFIIFFIVIPFIGFIWRLVTGQRGVSGRRGGGWWIGPFIGGGFSGGGFGGGGGGGGGFGGFGGGSFGGGGAGGSW
jgi:uncharacterized protein